MKFLLSQGYQLLNKFKGVCLQILQCFGRKLLDSIPILLITSTVAVPYAVIDCEIIIKYIFGI